MSSSQAFIHRHVNEHGACSKGRWTKLEEIMKLEGRGGLRSIRREKPFQFFRGGNVFSGGTKF